MPMTATKLFDNYGGGSSCRAYVLTATTTGDVTTTIGPSSATTSALVPKFVQVQNVVSPGDTTTALASMIFAADINLSTGVVTITRSTTAGGATSSNTATGIARVLVWDDLV